MMRVQTLMVTAVLVGVCVVLAGCPATGDKNIQLIVSPGTLDFNTSNQPIALTIAKNDTTREMGPAIVTPVESWIKIDTCQDIAAGCVSSGPSNAISVPVRVEHSLMTLGQNVGSIVIHSNGAPTQVVAVRAIAAIVPDFTVDERMPPVGRSIRFSDRTQSQLANEPIISYKWDFGDGSPVVESALTSVDHVYTHTGSFTVKLTVTTAQRSETVTRTSCVIVGGQTPVADFSMSADSIFEGQSIHFTDLSTGTANPIVSWRWVFKRNADGTTQTSSVQSPTQVFTQSGWYTVSLTVALSTATNAETATKTAQIIVKKYETPTANFWRGEGYVNTPLQFTDTSSPGSSPITSWSWSFGDGAGSGVQNPTHTYTAVGTYTVSLTVTTAQGTSQCSYQVTVSRYVLQAQFESNTQRIVAGDTVTFTSTTLHGVEPITSYAWDFGDGSTGVGAIATHVYNAVGVYTVKLTVTTATASNTMQKTNYITVYLPTPLDTYVRTPLPDPAFSYTLMDTIVYDNSTVFIFQMTSQEWRAAIEVDKPTWTHWVTIIQPKNVTNTRAMMIVSGGSNTSAMPSGVDSTFRNIATTTGSIVAEVKQIPSEPLVFPLDPLLLASRTEDEILAYSFWQYFQTADATWPALLPMVKSVVRAMDLVQEYMPTAPTPVTVKDFVVTGASKRGWTTWLTACTDGRVAAIAPMVIEVLNANAQMDHQIDVYGQYADAVHDYTDLNIFFLWHTAAGLDLLDIIDPLSYRERLTMPKLIFSVTGDEFFCPDSAQFYFSQLSGENALCIIPNVSHSMSNVYSGSNSGYGTAIPALEAWYVSLLPNHDTCPSITWTASNTKISLTTSTTPSRVLLWSAVSKKRDFRLESHENSSAYVSEPPYYNPADYPDYMPAWFSRELLPDDYNQYSIEPEPYADLYTGFFVQVYFDNSIGGTSLPYIFSTELRVLPPANGESISVNFSASAPIPAEGHKMYFTDLSSPGTRTIYSRYWDFGDGSTSNARNPSHTFGSAGSKSVTLKINNSDYLTITKNVDVP